MGRAGLATIQDSIYARILSALPVLNAVMYSRATCPAWVSGRSTGLLPALLSGDP
jgi:hypothetical protein